MPKLLISTRNLGKFEEIQAFLQATHPRLHLKSLRDFKNAPVVEEDCSTFLENARKKAKMISSFTGMSTLADDSGLEVECLGGRPGVFSARFAGPQATDAANTQKLLEKLKEVPAEKRRAAFVCVMVLYAPNGKSATAVGKVEGVIAEEPRGKLGFGYDPVFLIPTIGRTLAELTLTEKNRISHRAQALTKISEMLIPFWEDSQDQ